MGEKPGSGADSSRRNAEAAQQGVRNQSVQYSKLVRVTPGNKVAAISIYVKGNPKKNKTIEDYEKENKRLRMEVALMRDFLQSVERM